LSWQIPRIFYPLICIDESINPRIAQPGKKTIYQSRLTGIKKDHPKDGLFGLKINPIINSF